MPFIEIPVEIGTPVYKIESNQHDGAWVVLVAFDLSMLNGWGSYVFKTRNEAIDKADDMNQKFWRKE